MLSRPHPRVARIRSGVRRPAVRPLPRKSRREESNLLSTLGTCFTGRLRSHSEAPGTGSGTGRHRTGISRLRGGCSPVELRPRTGRGGIAPPTLVLETSVMLLHQRPKRPAGVAPASQAWEARALLLSYRRRRAEDGVLRPDLAFRPDCQREPSSEGSPLLRPPPGDPDGGGRKPAFALSALLRRGKPACAANKKPRARCRVRGSQFSRGWG